MYFDEAADRYTVRKLFFSLSGLYCRRNTDGIFIIFILIRDIKIRGADAAAAPKRAHCTQTVYTESRIIMVSRWLSPRSVWYLNCRQE